MAKAKTQPKKKKTPAKKPATKAAVTKSAARSKSVTKPAAKGKSAESTKPAAKASPKKTAFFTDKANLKKSLLIATGILVLIAGAIAVNYNNASQPAPSGEDLDYAAAKSFSDEIIQHLRAGECQQIFAKTSMGFQGVISEEEWMASCNVASQVLTGAASNVELADTNLDDDITEYSYRITATDDETYVITTQLVFRDGQWQLQGIDSRVEEQSEPTPES